MNFKSKKIMTNNKKRIIMMTSGVIRLRNVFMNWIKAIIDEVNSMDDATSVKELFVYIENLIVIKPTKKCKINMSKGKTIRFVPVVIPTQVDSTEEISVEMNGRTVTFGNQP